MGGFFGITSNKDCLLDVFFGTDYHSHLGTQRGGLAAYDPEIGLQRKIHSITNSPFRTKFEHIFDEMSGTAAIGCISDTDPQPMLVRSHLGTYAISTIGLIRNAEQLIDLYFGGSRGHFDAMTGGRVNTVELVAALIDQKESFAEGIKYAQSVIDGTCSILILKSNGHLIAARDKVGRIPVIVCKGEDGYAVTFESFAAQKLGYEPKAVLGVKAPVLADAYDVIAKLEAAGNKNLVV
ncbi:MAG: amidophosphoribosyltransferase, partial [Clostridia bacterium]|nr:amidophosphoribosyltransferase [Clostridia bacterium]